MELPPFAVTWDYRCPFARNAHEHLVTGLEAGAQWDVTFLPFSLDQVHVEEKDLSVWDDPAKADDLVALAAGVVARDRYPERFLALHRALFAARHDEGRDLRVIEVVGDIVEASGIDADELLAEVRTGWAQKEIRRAHELAVAEHEAFGVPTFIVGGDAVFVRLMERPKGDGRLAQATIERVVQTITDHPEINEFKHTVVAH